MMTVVVCGGGDGINCRNAKLLLVRRFPEVRPLSLARLAQVPHCRPRALPPNCPGVQVPRYLPRKEGMYPPAVIRWGDTRPPGHCGKSPGSLTTHSARIGSHPRKKVSGTLTRPLEKFRAPLAYLPCPGLPFFFPSSSSPPIPNHHQSKQTTKSPYHHQRIEYIPIKLRRTHLSTCLRPSLSCKRPLRGIGRRET